MAPRSTDVNRPEDPGKHDDGYPSSFTDSQYLCIRKIWQWLLEILDSKFSASSSITNSKHRKVIEKTLKTHSVGTLREAVWRAVYADDPDATMARFARAGHWDPEATFALIGVSIDWRIKNDVPRLLELGDHGAGGFKATVGGKAASGKGEKQFLNMYKKNLSYCLGTDRAGRPCAVINVAKHKIGNASKLALQRYVVITLEMLRTALVLPAQEGTVIWNMKGLTPLSWDFAAIKHIIDIFAKIYPQTVTKFIMYRAPFVIQPTYAILELALPSEVTSKVIWIYSKKKLLEYVSEEHLPKDLGGTAAKKGPYVAPTSSTETAVASTDRKRVNFFKDLDSLNKEYEDVTRRWVDGMASKGWKRKQEDKVLKERDEIQGERLALCRKGDHLWRASTELSRQGVIKQYGVTEWTYKSASGGAEKVEKWGKPTKFAANASRRDEEEEQDDRSVSGSGSGSDRSED